MEMIHLKKTNGRFYPNRSDLEKMIYRQRCRIQKGLLDQDNLSGKQELWTMDWESDYFYAPAPMSNSQVLKMEKTGQCHHRSNPVVCIANFLAK